MSAPKPSLPPLHPDYAAALEVLPSIVLADDVLDLTRPLMAGDDAPVVPDGVEWRDTRFGEDGLVRIYRRSDTSGPAGALLWIHGGGYVMGSYRNDADLIGPLVADTGIIVCSVEYPLAPEHPYPAPLEACYDTLAWMHQQAETLGIDSSRIGIAGLSAGGGLAAGLAIAARDRDEYPVAFVVLDSPMLDDRRCTVSSQHANIPMWSAESNIYGWASYLGSLSGTDDVPAHAAPARCENLSNLPPTFIAVGAVDGFRDEDTLYAMRLGQAGIDVEFIIYPGTPHGFRILGNIGVNERSITDIVRFIRRQLD